MIVCGLEPETYLVDCIRLHRLVRTSPKLYKQNFSRVLVSYGLRFFVWPNRSSGEISMKSNVFHRSTGFSLRNEIVVTGSILMGVNDVGSYPGVVVEDKKFLRSLKQLIAVILFYHNQFYLSFHYLSLLNLHFVL